MSRSLLGLSTLVTLLACVPRGEAMPPPTGGGGPAAPPEADEKKKGDDADKPEWKVDEPPYATKDIQLDVTEGTWMSLDVSPDGQTIVFDLLGDLYTMPITGGDAKPLTSGIAWDMQPQFSPDGKWVLFTSDRGGGDNAWIMGLGGGKDVEPRPVTKESFRLVNSPVWSPDGEYVALRKHFTSSRSLGAGEIWLYHRWGGKGVQLNKRPNDQKDLGEPAFSPDGRYIYYSQDATPGETFEYSKDVHGQIYVIKRMDLKESRTETFLSGPGGSVRPTPSPDGKQIAFIRRIGLKTVLMLHNLENGAERQLFDGLDRDMQETWAIHGVYPTMEWTPDNASIVLWAGGKIVRVDAATGQATDIPFHVKDTRKVSDAARYPVEVHPEKFDTRMLRWVNVSPDGKSVVYQALGHLYVRSLPDGQPRRLTRDEGTFEFFPSFSRDGKSIVYVAWNDRSLGSVRVVPVRGGKSRPVTREPGHYFDPIFTPDGQSVLYRKGSGGYQRSPRYSHDEGIYLAALRGKEAPRLVTRDGGDFHFAADPDRVYFSSTKYDDSNRSYELRSIDLDGSDERTHLDGKWVTAFRVSPDGKWVAFQDGFQVHVAPFPAAGKKFTVGPKMDALPVATVSKDAGSYLHWAGDSSRLYWSLGAELFQRDLNQSFAFLEGAPEELPEPESSGINIGFSADADVPQGTIALVGARVVTMKGDEVIEDGTIVVERNRIKAVGPSASVKAPEGARVIDAKGTTIIPGLVDVHAHGSQGREEITPQQNWLHYAELAFGVTTVHDPSNDTATIFAAAEMARAGLVTAPRIFSTGTILYGAETAFMARVDGLEDARRHLRRMKAVGAFSVKSYNQPRREQRQQIMAAARELEMMVVPEGGSLFQHNMTMVVDGHTGIEHAIPVGAIYDDVEQLWAPTGVGYTPTIVVGYGGVWGEHYWYAESDVFANERLRTFVPPFAYEPRARRRMKASEGDWNHIDVAKICKQLTDAGVSVNLGAHGQREGLAAHWELWSFAQGGMTPLEALRASTLNGAKYLGLDKDIGSLEVGKLADLVVIEGNPLEDIRTSEKIRHTMINGRLFDARTMDEVAPGSQKRAPFFWTEGSAGSSGAVPAVTAVCSSH